MSSHNPRLPQGMNFIEASLDVWEKFREIRREAMRTDPHAFGKPFKLDAEGDKVHWEKRLSAARRYIFGIEHAGRIISTLGTKELSDDVWLIFGAYTLPEYRGKGLAQSLMEIAIEKIRDENGSAVILALNSRQREALTLYIKLGFRIYERKKDQIAADGSVHKEIRMWKKLA